MGRTTRGGESSKGKKGGFSKYVDKRWSGGWSTPSSSIQNRGKDVAPGYLWWGSFALRGIGAQVSDEQVCSGKAKEGIVGVFEIG